MDFQQAKNINTTIQECRKGLNRDLNPGLSCQHRPGGGNKTPAYPVTVHGFYTHGAEPEATIIRLDH